MGVRARRIRICVALVYAPDLSFDAVVFLHEEVAVRVDHLDEANSRIDIIIGVIEHAFKIRFIFTAHVSPPQASTQLAVSDRQYSAKNGAHLPSKVVTV